MTATLVHFPNSPYEIHSGTALFRTYRMKSALAQFFSENFILNTDWRSVFSGGTVAAERIGEITHGGPDRESRAAFFRTTSGLFC